MQVLRYKFTVQCAKFERLHGRSFSKNAVGPGASSPACTSWSSFKRPKNWRRVCPTGLSQTLPAIPENWQRRCTRLCFLSFSPSSFVPSGEKWEAGQRRIALTAKVTYIIFFLFAMLGFGLLDRCLVLSPHWGGHSVSTMTQHKKARTVRRSFDAWTGASSTGEVLVCAGWKQDEIAWMNGCAAKVDGACC